MKNQPCGLKERKEIEGGIERNWNNKNNALRMKGKDRNYAEVLGQKLLDSAKRLSTYEKKEMSEELR